MWSLPRKNCNIAPVVAPKLGLFLSASTMILRDQPDLPPRPLTPANAEFRRRFYAHWGRENAVILFRTWQAEFPPYTQALSIKRAWGGSEDQVLPARRLRVGERHGLILNDRAHYGAHIASPTRVTSLGVFFRPGMAQECAGAPGQSTAEVLDRESEPMRADGGFAEHLRPLDGRIYAQLTAIGDAVLAGRVDDHGQDEDWLEAQLQALLTAMLAAEPGWRARRPRPAGHSRSAHAELLRRVDGATDFILSSYTQPLSLDDIAAQARLSKYHLVRVYRQIHGATPMAFLARTRTAHAERLVLDTALSLDEVVELIGFGSRQTLFRQLRQHCGDGGRALRQIAAQPSAAPID